MEIDEKIKEDKFTLISILSCFEEDQDKEMITNLRERLNFYNDYKNNLMRSSYAL